MYLIYSLLFSLGFNIAMFLVAYKQQTDKLTDISYSLTFGALAVFAFAFRETNWNYSWLVSLMVLVWAIRLGSYLLVRIRKIGKDKRFDEMRSNFWVFSRFWLLQGVTVWIVSLGLLVFMKEGFEPSTPLLLVGIGVWASGLVIEAFSDWQKFTFINNPKNKGKWIDSGLWKYSRHPNYYGEMLVWYGFWVAIVSGLDGSNKWLALVSPLFISFLLLFVSGVPLLEKSADKRWGKDPKYQQYKKNTSAVILLPKKGQ